MAVSRREALALLGSAIGVGALASCSPQGPNQNAPASSAADTAAADAAAADTAAADAAAADNAVGGSKSDTRIDQARFTLRHDADPFILLHFSDIHGNGEALGRILTWASTHAYLLDDAIVSGDIARREFSDGLEFWDQVEGANRVLTCIGNHDVYDIVDAEDTEDAVDAMDSVDAVGRARKSYDNVTVADVAARYIDVYCGSWGAIDHVAGTTWYAKDYPERGVRLVVLDCMLYVGEHSGDEAAAQDAWLESTLADAAAQGLTVVVVEHFPLAKESSVDCSWASFDRRVSGIDFLDARVTDRIQAFIDGGGSFACYLCGHSHRDSAHTLPGHPEQFALSIACASDDREQTRWGDMNRSLKATRDVLNVVVVDTANKLVKVVRIGADRDLALQHRGNLCWSYGAHRLVYAD